MQCSSTLTPDGLLQLTQLQQTIKQLEKDKDRLKLEKEAKATELELSRIEWQRDSATQLVSSFAQNAST
jgi:cell division protein FtsB